jgi:ankyrin repeat protein
LFPIDIFVRSFDVVALSLIITAYRDQVHIYDHVLDTLKQKRTVSKDTYSLFFQVCHEGATVPKWKEILEAMFLMQDFDLNAIHEETHRTGLSFAAHAGNVEVVQFLLSLTSIDPVKCNDTKLSPLHFACMSDSPDTVRELVKHPKVCDNINAVSSTWRTALTIACESGSLDMVNILLGVEVCSNLQMEVIVYNIAY